jgi:HD superfamily phosphodiesterase
LEILAASLLLHDCVEVPKDSPLRSQASRLAAVNATAQLPPLGWSAKRTDWVASAIESHSYLAKAQNGTGRLFAAQRHEAVRSVYRSMLEEVE